MKELKKIYIFSIALLLIIGSSILVKAEEVCTDYTNYYFFSEINSLNTVQNGISNANDHIWKRSHRTYFPKLPEGAKLAENYVGERVCLKKNGLADGTCTETWTLEDFYEKYKNIMAGAANNLKEFYTTSSSKKSTYIILTEGNNNYYLHGKWFEILNGVEEDNGRDRVKYNNIDTSTLIGGSFLPNLTSISFDFTQKYSLYATIERHISNENISGITPFALDWYNNGNVINNTTLAPALYKIKYQICKDIVTYKATINYYYYKDGEITKDRIKLDDGTTKEPYLKEQLVNGDGESVSSPSLKNCTIVDTNGKRKDADKTVTYKINNGNFDYDVYYSCDTFKATIDYYYYKDGKTTTEKVEFDKNEKNPYTESGFLPGETKPVDSPEKKGCTIVDTKGKKYDADKKVTIAIDKENPKDFEKKVYYYCPSEEEAKTSPKTGDALIYLAWAIGLGAIGYSVYYFKKLKKEEI